MIHFVCFSRQRPLQLEGYLRSLKKYVRGEAAVDVLVKQDAGYEEAYQQVQDAFPDVRFFDEDDFASNIQALSAIPCDFLCYGCDDVIFQRPVEMELVETLMRQDNILAISLRLARHVTHGFWWNSQPQPDFNSVGQFLVWNTMSAIDDWRYVWDVLGSIYRYDFVEKMLPALVNARNPSQFEDIGSRTWPNITSQRLYACWSDARTCVPTPNVVQTEFPNGFVGGCQLDPDFLLDCWKRGLRMDIDRYTGRYATWRIGDFHLTRL